MAGERRQSLNPAHIPPVTGAKMHEASNAERWLPVVGYEGIYEVSDLGSVRSLLRTVDSGNGRQRVIQPRVLRPAKMETGYLILTLSRGGGRETRLVHHLVLEAFEGPRMGRVARHLNGDTSSPRAVNLAWGSQEENEADKVSHGTSNRGERCHNAKLTGDQVRMIRRVQPRGVALRTMAADLGVSQDAIRHVLNRTTWKHI